MISAEEFRELVDQTESSVEAVANDLQALYAHVGITGKGSYSRESAIEHLRGQIPPCFSGDLDVARSELRALCHEIIYDAVLNDQPQEPSLTIASALMDAVPQNDAKPGQQDDMPRAIQLAVDVNALNVHRSDHQTYVDPRVSQVAQAAKRLRELGYNVDLVDREPLVSEAGLTAITVRLDQLVSQLGGFEVADQIFHQLRLFKLWDSTQERYHLVRRVSAAGLDAAPQVPYGHLLQVAVKHPGIGAREDLDTKQQLWKELIELSSDFAATFDVQPYSQWSSMFQGPRTIIPFLRELMVYDRLFTIRQMRPSDAIRIIKGVLDFVDWDCPTKDGWTLRSVIGVAAGLEEVARGNHGPVATNARDLPRNPDTPSGSKVFDVIESVFSHPCTGVNRDYTLPTDERGSEFNTRPLLTNGRGDFVILDRSVCAPALAHSVLNFAKSLDDQFSSKLGYATERFLRAEFENHGMQVVSGKYRADDQDGECDIIVEATDSVIFFEVKKRPLTVKAMAGNDVRILLDLAHSAIESQLQAGRHELLLRKKGQLEIRAGDGTSRIVELAGREVERVAVTLFDYGSLQDRVVLHQLLQVSLQVNYSSNDLVWQRSFDALKKKLDDLRQQDRELDEVVPSDPNRPPFMHCWFLSVPQILILLDDVTCNEDFKRSLWSTRHMTTGSHDFYFEHSYAKSLRQKQ